VGTILHSQSAFVNTGRLHTRVAVSIVLMLLVGLFALPAAAASDVHERYAPGELLVRFERRVPERAIEQLHAQVGAQVMRTYTIVESLQHIRLPAHVRVEQALAMYRRDPAVRYAEPNFVWRTLEETQTIPNDPDWNKLWGMEMIDAPAAWDITTGSEDVVVFVIDTGGDYNHEDLIDNAWPDLGYNAIDDTNDPWDHHGHGTHVSGTIGAVGNNTIGVAGVNWEVTLGWAKFLGPGGGYTSQAIACLEYILDLKVNQGVNVIATNNSWGGGGYSEALLDAIVAHREAGILFVAAAGNDGTDNDIHPMYPASYREPGIISVAATDSGDHLSWFSNYGQRTVHLGAPGSDIYSTIPGDEYAWDSGTSMAAPHVTGVIALLAAQDPTRDWRALRNLVLSSGDDIAATADTTITGKRLNAHGALTCFGEHVEGVLRPVRTVWASPGDEILLEYLSIECAEPRGPVTVQVSGMVSTSVSLRDDGVAPDLGAGDGIFANTWTVPDDEYGTYYLTFPDGDTVAVNVYKPTLYSYASVAYDWRDIVGTSFDLALDESALLSLPFPIDILGTECTELYVHDNGAITLEPTWLPWYNDPLPDVNYEVLIALWWDDLIPFEGTDQNVFWDVVGAAPNRELVIEWRDVSHYDWAYRVFPDNTVRFQVVFPEAAGPDRGKILFQYRDTYFGSHPSYPELDDANYGGTATIGVQVSSDLATQFSYYSPSLFDNMAIAWEYEPVATPAVFRVERETGHVLADGGYHGSGFHTGGADLAEWVQVSELVEPGHVLEIDPTTANTYRLARGPCSDLVAGVVSTTPGIVLGGEIVPSSEFEVLGQNQAMLALLGVVPVKVTDEGGPIATGDLLTVSSTTGYAMRWDPDSGQLCGLVGKALEPHEEGEGVIEVLLTR